MAKKQKDKNIKKQKTTKTCKSPRKKKSGGSILLKNYKEFIRYLVSGDIDCEPVD